MRSGNEYTAPTDFWSSDEDVAIVDDDGTVTAIEVVKAEVNDGNAVKNVQEGWYTLQGVKLDSAPTQKGIYIYNGKKVAVQ